MFGLKFILLTLLLLSTPALSQLGSKGPGKGLPPGSAPSKYTFLPPAKPTPYTMKDIRPANQVPEHQEKYTWLLTSKINGRDPDSSTSDVPVYTFERGKRSQVGYASAGEEIVMSDVRAIGGTMYYRYEWSGGKKDKVGPEKEYWVSGANIEFGGKK
jgi:hypothetical protein